MAKLKAYTLGRHGFIGSDIREALGEPSHIRQASVILVASSKRAAIVELEARRRIKANLPYPSLSDPDFRVDDGRPLVEAMRAAGLLDEPTVLVASLDARPGNPVLRISAAGEIERIGTVGPRTGPAFVRAIVDGGG